MNVILDLFLFINTVSRTAFFIYSAATNVESQTNVLHLSCTFYAVISLAFHNTTAHMEFNVKRFQSMMLIFNLWCLSWYRYIHKVTTFNTIFANWKTKKKHVNEWANDKKISNQTFWCQCITLPSFNESFNA